MWFKNIQLTRLHKWNTFLEYTNSQECSLKDVDHKRACKESSWKNEESDYEEEGETEKEEGEEFPDPRFLRF